MPTLNWHDRSLAFGGSACSNTSWSCEAAKPSLKLFGDALICFVLPFFLQILLRPWYPAKGPRPHGVLSRGRASLQGRPPADASSRFFKDVIRHGFGETGLLWLADLLFPCWVLTCECEQRLHLAPQSRTPNSLNQRPDARNEKSTLWTVIGLQRACAKKWNNRFFEDPLVLFQRVLHACNVICASDVSLP